MLLILFDGAKTREQNDKPNSNHEEKIRINQSCDSNFQTERVVEGQQEQVHGGYQYLSFNGKCLYTT